MQATLTRRTAGLAALAGFVALASGCATKPDVRTDQEPGTNLGAYRTFAFYDTAQPGYMSLLEKRVRAATRAQLERAHYTYDERFPDLRVNYALHVVEKQEIRSTPQAGRFGYRSWSGGNVESVEYRQGTLAIDLVDAKRNALVWRAVAEGRLDAKSMEQPGEAIDAAVGELFTRLPGAAK